MTPAPPIDFTKLYGTGNPDLDAIAALPPGAHAALAEHGDRLLNTPPPTAASSAPAAGPAIGMPPAEVSDAALKPMAPPAMPAPRLAPTPMEQHQGELNRLTAPPVPGLEHTRASTGQPGWQQIHNPILRTLAGIGNVAESTFFPGAAMLTPGTDLHHQMLVRGAERAVGEDEGQLNQQSKRELEAAQTKHAEAEAENVNPKTQRPVPLKAGEGLWNPTTKSWDVEPKGEEETTEITKEVGDALGIVPTKDGRYLLPKGGASLLKPVGGKEPTNAFELWHQQNPKSPAEDWLKIEEQNRPGTQSEYADFKKAALAKNPNMPADQIVKDFAAAHQAPQRPPESLMIVPGQNGAPGRAIAVGAGTQVPASAINVGGQSQENVKVAEQEQAAVKARADAQKEYQLAQNLAAHPSPTNDVALLMRYIGATKPDSLGKLRLNQNEISLVLGTRSTLGDLEALEQKVVNGQKLTPQQRKDMLDSMRILGGIPEGGAAGATPSAAGWSVKVVK